MGPPPPPSAPASSTRGRPSPVSATPSPPATWPPPPPSPSPPRLPARPSSRPSSSTPATPSPTGSTRWTTTIVSAENDPPKCGTETSSSCSYKEDVSDFCGLKSLIRHHHAGFKRRRGTGNTSCNSLTTVRQNIDDAVQLKSKF